MELPTDTPEFARDVYLAIMRAAAHGKGLILTADEIKRLSHDDAIATAAENRSVHSAHRGWADINPKHWRRP